MLKPGTTVVVEGYPSTRNEHEMRAERITVAGKTVELRWRMETFAEPDARLRAIGPRRRGALDHLGLSAGEPRPCARRGLLVGAIAVFDIQVLRRAGNLRTLARADASLAIAGLVIQLASGLVLLSAEASTVVAERGVPVQDADAALGLDQRGGLPRALRPLPRKADTPPTPPARSPLISLDRMGPGAARRTRIAYV